MTPAMMIPNAALVAARARGRSSKYDRRSRRRYSRMVVRQEMTNVVIPSTQKNGRCRTTSVTTAAATRSTVTSSTVRPLNRSSRFRSEGRLIVCSGPFPEASTRWLVIEGRTARVGAVPDDVTDGPLGSVGIQPVAVG
jgi:hypothetical protein